MAFAKQYFSSYKSNNNLDYYLEIWVDGFDSSATEISVGAGGPVISYETDQEDRFSPILSSQCELPFVVKDTTTQAFIQLLRTTYKERQVYLHLYRATSSTYTTTKPIWSGFLVMDLGSGEDVSFPYEQKLTFVDGLSLLKDIDFVDLSNAGSETNIQGSYTQDNMYYGPAIYTFWIKEILAKAGCATTTQGVSIDYGFTTAVNWYNADMQNTNQGSDPLGLTQCVVSMFHNKNDQDVFTPENCYTVLKELLRHWGARITYWKHEFWIVQIPEYIQDESGLIDNPDNINSRQYNRFGTLTGSQDHLGDTYYTRYEQTIQGNQVSKLVGTKYNYLPMIHNAEADFLSFASKNYYGGFPYGVSAESQEIFQGTIIDPSTANFLWLSIPLNWTWDMTGSSLTAGHENGWWCSVRFNFYASDGTTTYYLQYDSSGQGSYYWVLEADWTPLGNTSPKYIIKSRNLTETNYIGFQENIPFVDSSGSAITMTGAWSFFLDIEDFANQSSSGNNGSFYCRFSGYAPSSHYDYVKKDPYQEFPYLPTTSDVSGGGPQTKSGTVRWSNTLENPSGVTTTSFSTPVGFDAGTSQADIQLITTSPFKGLLQTLNTTQSSSFGLSLNTQVNNSTNTEKFSFGTLLWGDAIQQFAVGCLRVNNGTAFVKTNPDGEWGRGTLTGDNTFTELLIDEFLSGQIKVVIAPTMRLAVGEENKNQTATGTSGPATRPRYVNPIGRLREFRSNETDPEYIFRRGSFHSLYDEWDYEGYQILRDTVSSTTTTTDIGDLGGTQDNKPISNAKMIGNVNNALMMNSPVAYLRTTVPATGSNVAVNGNFNTAVGWTLGTGWSIDTTAKKAKFAATGSTSELTQSVLTQGLTYQVNFQVVVTAGTLLVKAGTSGTSLSITTSGDYSFYLDCDGSNLIKFQAGTTFTGNITYITLRDQKSISSVPINSIGSTVFKSGDTFNLINSLGGEILPLTVSSNQGATDDTISVTSTALFDDIGIDSVLLINQDDLSAQYQNKTKGTVGGFDITATSIDSGSVSIGSYIDDDTFATASATSLATSESIKAYVDGQAGHSETLQEVTDNGNTTTNSVMIGSSSSPSDKLDVYGNIKLIQTQNYIKFANDFVTVKRDGNNNLSFNGYGGFVFYNTQSSSEHMRLTSGGNLGIGTSSPARLLSVNGVQSWSETNTEVAALNPTATGTDFALKNSSGTNVIRLDGRPNENSYIINGGNLGIGTSSPSEKLHVVGDALITGDSHADAFKPAVTGNPIKFKNFGGTDVARITDGGSLLLGTTTDSGYKLEVNGTGSFFGNIRSGGGTLWSDSNGGVQLGYSASDATGYLTTYYNTTSVVIGAGVSQKTGITINGQSASVGNKISFRVGDSEKMRLTSAGRLGIGTTNPLATLHVLGSAVVSSYIYMGTTQRISWGNGNQEISATNDAQIDFKTGGSEKMRLTSGGNLGIGLTNPDKLIDIASSGTNTNAPTFRITNTANNSASNWNGKISHAIEFYSADPSRVGLASSIQNIAGTDKGGVLTGNITFNTADWPSGGINERMRITDGGNVGIGTANPSGASGKTLEIYGGSGQARLAIKNDDTGGGSGDGFQISLGSGVGGRVTLEQRENSDMAFSTNAAEKMRLTSGGNLLIGTTTDSGYKLTVAGDISLTNNNTSLLGKTTGGSNLAIFKLDSSNNFQYGSIYAGASSIMYTATDFLWYTYPSSVLSQKMTLKQNGNLLIGTTTDSGDKLQVNGSLTGTTAKLTQIELGDNQPIYLGAGAVMKIFNDGANSIIRSQGEPLNIDANGINFRGYSPYNNLMKINSNGNVLIGTTTDSGFKLRVNGDSTNGVAAFKNASNGRDTLRSENAAGTRTLNVGNDGSGHGILLLRNSSGTTTSYLSGSGVSYFNGGNVLIGTTTDSGVYRLDVSGKARVQSVFELDDVLTLNQISTPADPASGQSSIYMDSADGAIKVKINVGGTVVTRTIASFE